MGDGQITQKRIAEPVPNVESVRRIPVVYWREIKSLSELNTSVEQKSVVFENSKMYLKELWEGNFLT